MLKLKNSQEMIDLVQQSLRLMLKEVVDDIAIDVRREFNTLKMSEAEINKLQDAIQEFSSTKISMINIIDQYCNKWGTQLPKILDHEFQRINKSVEEKINNNNKWVDHNSCLNLIVHHTLPYEIGKLTRNIEEYFSVELEELNDRLNSCANQTIKRLTQVHVNINSKEFENVLSNIAQKVVKRFAGKQIKRLLTEYGGVGGAAAGMGNLAKTSLKKVGGVFKKKFPKEIYAKIGKIFNKKLLAKLNIALDVIIETVGYINDALTWQSKLNKNISQELEKIRVSSKDELLKEIIDEIRKTNIDTVEETYNEVINDYKNDIQQKKNEEFANQKIIYFIKLIDEINLELGE